MDESDQPLPTPIKSGKSLEKTLSWNDRLEDRTPTTCYPPTNLAKHLHQTEWIVDDRIRRPKLPAARGEGIPGSDQFAGQSAHPFSLRRTHGKFHRHGRNARIG